MTTNTNAALIKTLQGLSDKAYYDYIVKMQSDECLGWEHKVKARRFTDVELKAHTKAGELLGRHRAFSEAVAQIQSTAAQPPAGWVMGQPITEEMHIAACKILRRANGLDGLPQRMLDAMMAAKAEPAQPHVQIPPENVHVDCDVSRKAGKVDTSAAPKAEPGIFSKEALAKALAHLEVDEEEPVQQPERVPLTDEQINKSAYDTGVDGFNFRLGFRMGARFAERAHGIQPAHRDQQ